MDNLVGFDHTTASKAESKTSAPNQNGLFQSAVDSFRYALIQEPLDGVTQLSDHIFNTDFEKNVQFFKPNGESKTGTAGWFGDRLGGIVGSALPFLALSKFAGPGAASDLELTDDYRLGMGSISPIAKSFAAGAAYTALATPVDGNSNNFWLSKAEASAAGGASFGAMTAASIGLKSTGNKFLNHDIVAGAISGVPAGLIGANAESLMNSGHLASLNDNIDAVGTYTAGGALLGGANLVHEHFAPNSGIQGVRTLNDLTNRADGTVTADHPARYAYSEGKTAPDLSDVYHSTYSALGGGLAEGSRQMIARSTGDLANSLTALQDVGPQVTVYGSARLKENTFSYQRSRLLGGLLAQDGYAVKTGGAFGIMEGANRGAYEANGKSIGVNLELPHEPFGGNGYQTLSLNHKDFASRKEVLRQSNAFVVEDGGLGTLDEFAELLTHIQTAKAEPAPVYVYRDAWEPVTGVLNRMLQRGTIANSDFNLFKLVDSPYDIANDLKQRQIGKIPPPSPMTSLQPSA